MPQLSDKTLMQCFQMTNRIMCRESGTLSKLILFQLMEQHRSWDNILKLIYWIDAHAINSNKKKKSFAVEYELSFTLYFA